MAIARRSVAHVSANPFRQLAAALTVCHLPVSQQVLTKALQLHPNAAGLWSRAAAWELQHNGNAAAARALMQRGLRMARNSPHLWVEYFQLELTYAHRLRARRRILGLGGEGGAHFDAEGSLVSVSAGP